MGKRTWTEEEERKLEELYKEGKSFKDIAEIMNKSANAVSKRSADLGLIEYSNRKWTDEQIKKLIAMNNEKYTMNDIVDEIGKSCHSIREKLKKLNLSYMYKKANSPTWDNVKLISTKNSNHPNKKTNLYILDQDYGIGVCSNGYRFYFDLEDYSLIKDYSWHQHQDGYLRTCYAYFKDDNGKRHNKYIMMHQLLSNEYFNGAMLDHKNGNAFDNRKENLRPCTHAKNMRNTKLSVANTSGHKGVYYSVREDKWKAGIQIDNNQIHLGTFDTYEEAVKVREEAEDRYFGQWNREAI